MKKDAKELRYIIVRTNEHTSIIMMNDIFDAYGIEHAIEWDDFGTKVILNCSINDWRRCRDSFFGSRFHFSYSYPAHMGFYD